MNGQFNTIQYNTANAENTGHDRPKTIAEAKAAAELKTTQEPKPVTAFQMQGGLAQSGRLEKDFEEQARQHVILIYAIRNLTSQLCHFEYDSQKEQMISKCWSLLCSFRMDFKHVCAEPR